MVDRPDKAVTLLVLNRPQTSLVKLHKAIFLVMVVLWVFVEMALGQAKILLAAAQAAMEVIQIIEELKLGGAATD
jgi:hypothetical protein